MKNIRLIVFLLFFGYQGYSQSESKRTEEYAIVDVFEHRKSFVIRVSFEGKETSEKEWKVEKADKAWSFNLVLKELGKLNELGFELLNNTMSYKTSGSSTVILSESRHTFMMVRKIK